MTTRWMSLLAGERSPRLTAVPTRTLLLSAGALALAGCASGLTADAAGAAPVARPDPSQAQAQRAPLPACSSPSPTIASGERSPRDSEAKALFQQGLTLAYGFNHHAAVATFERAAQLDPAWSMPHWGVALALGPNINDPLVPERAARARSAIEHALRLAACAGDGRERDYVAAMALRYGETATADLEASETRYIAAMRSLAAKYPDDPDAATLLADALMNQTPWEYWTQDGRPGPLTEEILATLERALRLDPEHLGANHYLIHAIEASPHPERGLPSALRLESVPHAAGHLAHMPSHIYWRTGDYDGLVRANLRAIGHDRAHFAAVGGKERTYQGYYAHNLDFLVLGHSYRGDYAAALQAAEQFEREIEEVLASSPGAEVYLTRTLSVRLRFGRWSDVLSAPEPSPSRPFSRTFWAYAQGVALAASGRAVEAEQARTRFQRLRSAVASDARVSRSQASQLLDLAAHVLDGRIAAARGDHAAAAARLAAAASLEDRLPYDEPPNWYYPVRETLGAVLLNAGEASEAEAVFRADLALRPRNPRALFGLEESLRAQGRQDEAAVVAQQRSRAWRGDDAQLSLRTF